LIVLGLDTATVTGWAVGEPRARPLSGSERLKRRGEGPEIAALGMLRLVRRLILEHEPGVLFIEKYMNPAGSQNAAASVLLLQCFGVASATAMAFGLRVEAPQRSTILKHFVDNGRPPDSKRAVIRRAIALGYMPADCRDDNRADALAVWDFGCAQLGATPDRLVLFGEGAAA
jgi:Holliday junction resolvasome RuvABC endonuclease subunit